MSNEKLRGPAALLARRAGGPIDAAIVLGSGLAPGVLACIDGSDVPYARLAGAPAKGVAGHPGHARVGHWAGKRVVAFAGRVHLYQGYGPRGVTYFVRLAAAAGVKTLVLTNAAGGLNESYAPGDIMAIADHLNLTGKTPLRGAQFIDLADAYAPRLRALAHGNAAGVRLREGVYAGVAGPAYETAAEARALQRLGADAVGMSTVLETIAARALGLDVLGLSLITNAIAPSVAVSHAAVLASSEEGSGRIASVIESVLAAL